MKGLKCGLLLAFFIMLGLSLSVSSESNAVRYHYTGIPLISTALPDVVCDDGDCELGSEFDVYSNSYLNNQFSLQWFGDAKTEVDSVWDSSRLNSSRPLRYNLSFLANMQYNGSSCSDFNFPQGILSSSGSGLTIPVSQDFMFVPNNISVSQNSFNKYNCMRRGTFQDHNLSFDDSSIPSGYLECGLENGAMCDGIWDASDYENSQILPYWYGSDGIYLHDSYTDSSGNTYSYSFDPSSLFDGMSYLPAFSDLVLSLNDISSDFNYDSSELYSGREFAFDGAFEFDGNFEWHDGISSDNSYFRVYWNGVAKASSSLPSSGYVTCDTNFVSLSGQKPLLEYHCPFTFNQDYLAMSFSLRIHGESSNGDSHYVWKTNDNWRFYYNYLITDNDTSTDAYFNYDISGGASQIPGSAESNAGGGESGDFFSQLLNMFNISFLNPFLPIFSMFSDQSSCAQIPTLAGMLHSESSEVCPWFDSNTRNIVTPVLGIFGMMVVFGLAVRWLGSSSGNYVDDSDKKGFA